MERIIKIGIVSVVVMALSLLLVVSSRAEDIYGATGFNPYRETFSSMPNEHIDPLSGNLILKFEDIRLPGNGGLDFVVTRIFNSKSSCDVWGYWNNIWGCEEMSENNWIGFGWTLHFGRVFFPGNPLDGNPYIEMPDGSFHQAYQRIDTPTKYITKDYWQFDRSNPNLPILTLTNGTKIYYGQSGVIKPGSGFSFPYVPRWATKIEDVNGNHIDIYYASPGVISYVIDTVGRRINFTTATINGVVRLVSISGPGVSISYIHQSLPVGGRTILTQAKPPVGNPWLYAYDLNTFEITKLTSPAGGIINYTMGTAKVNLGFPFYYRVVTQKTTGGTVPAGTWTLLYSQGTYEDYTQISDPCGRTIKYSYYGYGSGLASGSMWKMGLPKSKEIVGEETIAYTWLNSASISHNDYKPVNYSGWDNEIYVALLSQQSITRDGKSYVTNYGNYDAYANPGSKSEAGDKNRITTLTYWYNTSKNIVQNKPLSETISGGLGGLPGTFITKYTYDANNGNLLQLNKYGVVTSFTYYLGNIWTKTDANGNKNTYEWSNGRISKITSPIYSVTRVVNQNGTIASEKNGRGYTNTFVYDGNLRLTKITPPIGNPTIFTYPTNNSYKQETRGQYYTTHYNDGFGRPTRSLDIKGIDTNIVYKPCGVRNYSTSNIGDTTYFDNFGRVIKITHKDNKSVTYAYSLSNVTLTDEALYKTYFTYYAFGNPDEKLLVSVKDALSGIANYNYNILGSLITASRGTLVKRFLRWVFVAQETRTFTYDTKNFLVSEVHPEKGTIKYVRDLVGNIKTKTDGLGTTSFVYDAINRLRMVDYGTGTVTFGYDNCDNRVAMNNPSVGLSYFYDASNRLIEKDQTVLGCLYTTVWSYDGNDNVKDLYYPSGSHVIYGYNAKNEVVSVTGAGWSVSNMTYYSTGTPIGLPKSFTYSNGKVTSLAYSPRNLMSGIDVVPSVLDLNYTHDPRGNTTSITNNFDVTKNQLLGYDITNRLATFNGPWGTGSYTYDPLGNRKTENFAGVATNYTYASNRLMSGSGGQPFSYSYNIVGDAISMSIAGLTYDLSYDRLHNVKSIIFRGGPSVTSLSLDYDGDGMRITKGSSLQTVVYHYDRGKIISETTPSGMVIADYVFSNGKLAVKKELSGVYFYHCDPAGTPLSMTNASGSVVWKADYLPFGEDYQISSSRANNKMFVGKEQDETGLYYFGARYLESMIGRFISPDPMGPVEPTSGRINKKLINNPQGMNRYAYSLNNPYRFLDPFGLIWVTIGYDQRRHIIENKARGILGWFTKEIGEGLPVQKGRPPFSDPAESLGAKRNVIQEWFLTGDKRDYDYDKGTQRLIEQKYQRDDYFGQEPHLIKDTGVPGPKPEIYDWFPKVQDRTYENFPNTTYDYSNVDPRERSIYFENLDKPKMDSPIIKTLK